ncbi:hypothetical protein [Gloeothece verrucosa]|uniref:Uncharacterized protein n=1 Tax=Gloeothece verrucosa (strain PCC 7822) TaxID=497965 RepID=E0UAG7_GLOV7|nr:hypothetical protein [Gloeothece verrucosa]ADN12708.1 hypothetical protein Cyan7822_0672 [Gloeothece verrucosa PCC 7822]
MQSKPRYEQELSDDDLETLKGLVTQNSLLAVVHSLYDICEQMSFEYPSDNWLYDADSLAVAAEKINN